MPAALTGCSKSDKAETKVSAVLLPIDEQHAESSSSPSNGDLINDLNTSEAVDFDSLELEVESELLKLGEYFKRQLNSPSSDRPHFVSPSFVGSAIDRKRLKTRYDGQAVKVGRWQFSDGSAPGFEGDDSFVAFSNNILSPWDPERDFRIEFKVYQCEMKDGGVLARLIAESFGVAKSGGGLQASSIWETTWNKSDSGDFTLQSTKVLGREEVLVDVEATTLLQECSSSIFADCAAWKTQLKFGLDQWARQIPGLDVIGDNGIAIGDINSDGLDDLYVCEGHGLPNLMLVQNPDGSVRDVASELGIDLLDDTRSALIVDLDNDGDQDLALATDECVVLYSNSANRTFQMEGKYLIGYDGSNLSAADFDGDGDLDLFLCKYRKVRDYANVLQIPESWTDSQSGGRNVLLRNEEGWIFRDVTEEVGLTENNLAQSRSAVWVDFDTDGDQDLFVANEWSTPRLYENQNGWFSDVTFQRGLVLPSKARSVSVGDFNRDSRPDLFVANDSSIQSDASGGNELNTESQVWYSRKESAGRVDRLEYEFRGYPLPAPIFSTQSSFGSAVADLNNDGLDDLLVANGYLSRTSTDDLEAFWNHCHSQELAKGDPKITRLKDKAFVVGDLIRDGFSMSGNQRNRCYLNLGSIGFANFSAGSGVDLLNDARAIATTDWDGDGDTDVVMKSRNGHRIRFLCNQIKSGSSIGIFLKGTESNRDAIGARVEVWLDKSSKPIVRWVSAGSGYLTQSSRRLQIGLGKAAAIKKVDVIWPSGFRQSFNDLLPNRSYILTEKDNQSTEAPARSSGLAIKPRKLDGNIDHPDSARSVFYPVQYLPRLGIVSNGKIRYRIESAKGQALLVVFHDGQERSMSVLESFAEQRDEFDRARIGCVAAFGMPSGSESGEGSRIEPRNWSWPSGEVSSNDLAKLKMVFGDWFYHQHLPPRPFGILIDRSGAVKAFYPNQQLTAKNVLHDELLCGHGYGQKWLELTGRSGIWLNTSRSANLNRLNDRLLALGFEEDVKHLNRQTSYSTARQLTMRGIELSSLNDLQLARVFFDRAIFADSQYILAHIEKGELFRKLAAEQGLEDVEKEELLLKAVGSFEKAIEIDPHDVEAVLGLANAHVDQNRVTPAIEKLQEFLQDHHESAKVHAILGRLLFARKEYVEATKHLTVAFDAHPTLPFVAGDLGFLYLGSGDAERAKKFLRLANRLQPGARNILQLLAESEFATGNHGEAMRLVESWLEGSPKHLRFNSILSWLLATSPDEKLRDPVRGLALMAPMLELYGDQSALTQEVVAACHAENGDFEAAIRLQEKAVKMVQEQLTIDAYSDGQKKGLFQRLQLYKGKTPYRADELSEMPIRPTGTRIDTK